MNISPQDLETCSLFYEGQQTKIYYQKSSRYGVPVLIKILNAEYPSPRQLVRFSNEFSLTNPLDISGIRKAYEYGTIGRHHALVLKYIEGQALKEAARDPRWSLADKLRMSISVAKALSEVHQHQIIHKDINSRNILLNPENLETSIIDFGIASQVDLKTHHLGNPERLEGSLQYISPEQTGRMNRIVDYRSDLYSLGVTLYELFSGRLPFETQDVMELVYCHIARQAEAPHSVVSDIPPIISAIIMKLLEKNAEDRYQSAYGVKVDLEKCLEPAEEDLSALTFELAQEDVSGRFQLPQRLYGRESQLEELLEAFDRVAREGATELMLVSGYSGVGKSSLIHEIHKPITARRGYFISGKFDQYQRNVPYYALQQAFDEFAAYLLTESDERLQAWKARILAAVGNNAQVLIDVIPRLALVLGEQPAVNQVGPQEAQNRFNMVFQNFVAAIAAPEHPLVLFLDDLQWTDSASLNLLKVLLNDPELRFCVMIFAYRDNEVDASHPFQFMLNDLEKAETARQSLHLKNLSRHDVNRLVADTLSDEASAVEPLADLMYQKTYGNAFFTTRLLQALFEEEQIRFDHARRRWDWDVEQIRTRGVSDNVLELMERKLTKLRPDTQEALKLAACIGNQFDLAILAKISEHSPDTVLKNVWEALQEGLIVPMDESYKLIEMGGTHAFFQFLHDRVQQGAYAQFETAERERIHLKIGKLLLKYTPETELESQIFDIVGHLNLAQSLLSEEERYRVLELNMQAGQKAKASAAYEAASKFFSHAERLLREDAWQAHYANTLQLYIEWSESTYLARQFDEAERLFEMTLAHARNVLDKVRLYGIIIEYYHSSAQAEHGINTALKALQELGVSVPSSESVQQTIMSDIETLNALMQDKTLQDILALPEMDDPYHLAALQIMAKAAQPAYVSGSPFFGYFAVNQVTLTLRHGKNVLSPYGFMLTAAVFGGVLNDIDRGYMLDELSLRFAEAYQHSLILGQMKLHWGWFLRMKHHLRETIRHFQEGLPLSLENGDFPYVSYHIILHCYHLFCLGTPLDKLQQTFADYSGLMQKTQVAHVQGFFASWRQLVANLAGTPEQATLLQGEFFDEVSVLPQYMESQATWNVAQYAVNKILLNYLFGHYEEACTLALQYEELISTVSMVEEQRPMTLFFAALSFARRYEELEEQQQQQYAERIEKIREHFEGWARHAPANYAHKLMLISAEEARLQQQDMQAMQLYEGAIAGAKEQKFIYEEAMAYECAALFYLAKGMRKIAEVYMQDARYAYQNWGASAKVAQLEDAYPQCFDRRGRAANAPVEETAMTTTMASGSGAAFLDIATMMKASQTLSQEMRLENVLQRLMEFVVENAGAQKGVLLLREHEEFLLQARIESDGALEVLQAVPLKHLSGDSSRPLSVAIVEYIIRTGESVVLADAAQDERFGRDAYLQRKQPKSLLCQPVLHKGEIVGILYLENNLSTNAFTPDRLELLNVLCSQAAISLENARLVENMREQERLQKEMELARQIQTAILPKQMEHPDFEIEAIMLPAEEVGGDYYDVLTGKGGELWIGIGDVSGHGVTPGLIMMMAQTIHAALATHLDSTPAEMIANLNTSLFRNVRERLQADHFMTFTTMKYEGAGRFVYAGAHLDMIVHRKASELCESIDTTGAFLNFIEDISHAAENAEFTLEIGDTLVLYTDGLTEAHKPGGDILDLPRFMEIVRRHAAKSPSVMRDAILEDVLAWSEGQRLDDMTLLVIRRRA